MVFERFTPKARHVIVLAQHEARDLGHDQITSEHLLFGVAAEAEGIGARVLAARGVDSERVAVLLEQRFGRGAPASTGQMPFTDRAHAAVKAADAEAERLGHAVVGTEHVLLGLVADPENGASTALASFGVADATSDVLRALEGEAE